jgi:uncharacterized protein YgiM (DUF1202 family)
MKNLFIISTVLLLCLNTPASADDGMIIRISTVFSKTSTASDPVAQIAAGTKVSVLERQGGWKLIFSYEKALTGWVRSYQVRSGYYAQSPAVQTEPDSRGFLAGLATFSRKASGFFGIGESEANNNTATIGVRGLSEEEIRTAVPDFEELNKMHQFASSTKRVATFSVNGQLAARQVAHLEVIKPVKSKRKKSER